MNHWGMVSLIAFLVALGLILRFGKSSNSLLGTFFQGTGGWLNTLTLSSFQGNNP